MTLSLPTASPALRILQCNILGLRSRRLEVIQTLNQFDVDVALSQETRLPCFEPFDVPGYQTYWCCCHLPSSGASRSCRGIATLIHNGLCAGEIPIGDLSSTDVLGHRIKVGGQLFSIFNIYQPCRAKVRLPEVSGTNVILAGDFNACSVRWGYPKRDSVVLAVERYLDRYGLRVHQTPISPPTFIRKGSGESSRPDLTITTPRLFRVSETKVLEDIGSDHLPLLTTITLNFRRDVTAPIHFIYKDADWNKFTSILEDGVTTLDIKKGTIDQTYQRLTRLIMLSLSG